MTASNPDWAEFWKVLPNRKRRCADIASELGVSQDAVRNAASRYGVRLRHTGAMGNPNGLRTNFVPDRAHYAKHSREYLAALQAVPRYDEGQP